MAIPIIGEGVREKKVIVFSHERSGTHFLMNTIAENFGYNSRQWIEVDHIPLNMWNDEVILRVFHTIKLNEQMNMVKSHHSIDFFINCIQAISEDFHVFYIHRNGKDVMKSFAKHLNYYPWRIGPKVNDGEELAQAEPWGAVMRYQMSQYPNMWERWSDHVAGWLTRMPNNALPNIMYIKYDDLNDNFNDTVRAIGKKLRIPCLKPKRPSKDENVIP